MIDDLHFAVLLFEWPLKKDIARLQFTLMNAQISLCVSRTGGGGGVTVQMKEAADTLVQGKKVISTLHNS